MNTRLSGTRQQFVLACVLAVGAVAALILGVRWLDPSWSAMTWSAMTEDEAIMRWESYGGVELQVPASWGYGMTGWPPCLQKASDEPYVGRPIGAIPAIGCSEPVAPLDKRKAYLWFDAYRAPPGLKNHDGGWVEETRVVAGVALTVLSDDATLRGRMLDSAREVRETDAYGCPVDHPITTGPDLRPDSGTGGLATVGQVESITVCRYALDRGQNLAPEPVLSASRLTGSPARQLVDAVLAAPAGGGPNASRNGSIPSMYGAEAILLRVHGERDQEVYVRYSGSDGHGIDDGATLRTLTADVLRPLLRGPHTPGGLDGPVGRMVWRTAGTKR
jgi:hypothetical protein